MKESLPFLSGILLLIRHSVKTERGISGELGDRPE